MLESLLRIAMHLRMLEGVLIGNKVNIRLDSEMVSVDIEWACERRKAFLEDRISCVKTRDKS